MCLLIALFQVHPESPLVVAANRDELLARPARPMEVLRERDPRLLGGRDLVAGGTWMAVSERGVIGGLTNVPSPGGRDPARRSRGELPLLLAGAATAEEGAASFVARVRPADYNPCWLLVGDRDSLHYIDLRDAELRAVRLGPGIHVLENRPLGADSPKVDQVRERVAAATGWLGATLVPSLHALLGDHQVPARARAASSTRPPETEATCVHAGPYGTRSSTIVRVPPERAALPEVHFTDGPPCTHPLDDATPLWRRASD